jgi:hypothetical protein
MRVLDWVDIIDGGTIDSIASQQSDLSDLLWPCYRTDSVIEGHIRTVEVVLDRSDRTDTIGL